MFCFSESESSEYSEDSAVYEDVPTTTKSSGPRKNINKGRWTKDEVLLSVLRNSFTLEGFL